MVAKVLVVDYLLHFVVVIVVFFVVIIELQEVRVLLRLDQIGHHYFYFPVHQSPHCYYFEKELLKIKIF